MRTEKVAYVVRTVTVRAGALETRYGVREMVKPPSFAPYSCQPVVSFKHGETFLRLRGYRAVRLSEVHEDTPSGMVYHDPEVVRC